MADCWIVRRISAGSVWRYSALRSSRVKSFRSTAIRCEITRYRRRLRVCQWGFEARTSFSSPGGASFRRRKKEGFAGARRAVPDVGFPVALKAVDALEETGLDQPLCNLVGDLIPATRVQVPEGEVDRALPFEGGFFMKAERGKNCRTHALGFVHSLRSRVPRDDDRESFSYNPPNYSMHWPLPGRGACPPLPNGPSKACSRLVLALRCASFQQVAGSPAQRKGAHGSNRSKR